MISISELKFQMAEMHVGVQGLTEKKRRNFNRNENKKYSFAEKKEVGEMVQLQSHSRLQNLF